MVGLTSNVVDVACGVWKVAGQLIVATGRAKISAFDSPAFDYSLFDMLPSFGVKKWSPPLVEALSHLEPGTIAR